MASLHWNSLLNNCITSYLVLEIHFDMWIDFFENQCGVISYIVIILVIIGQSNDLLLNQHQAISHYLNMLKHCWVMDDGTFRNVYKMKFHQMYLEDFGLKNYSCLFCFQNRHFIEVTMRSPAWGPFGRWLCQLFCGEHVINPKWSVWLVCAIGTSLTHWGRDKMAAVSPPTLSNAFSWMKILEFRLRFHGSLFLRVQLTIFQHWFR